MLLKKHQAPQFKATEMRYFRSIAGKLKFYQIRNQKIRKITKQGSATITIKLEEHEQFNPFGHIMRIDLKRLTRKILETAKSGK